MDGNYEVVVIRSKNEVRMLKDSLTEKDAQKLKEDWVNIVFNAESFYEPVPKLKVRKMNSGNEE